MFSWLLVILVVQYSTAISIDSGVSHAIILADWLACFASYKCCLYILEMISAKIIVPRVVFVEFR